MKPPSDALYACVHAADFPAQSLLRIRHDLQSHPVVVMEGKPPQEEVCSMNRHAVRAGALTGMTRLDVESIPALRMLMRSPECESVARAAMLECCAQFSPRIEEAADAFACSFVLDMGGTSRLFGSARQIAERLRTALSDAGIRASIAVSSNFHASRIKAASMRGVAIVSQGDEASALEKLSIHYLDLPEDRRDTFQIWGIQTLGELAALPEVELVTRLGPDARRWRELARGICPHMFRPIEPDFVLREYYAFEDPVEQLDSILFIGARMIDCLVARTGEKALNVAEMKVSMKLEGGSNHVCVLRPAIPSADRKFLLKLMQLEIAAHPPASAVTALEITAEAGQSSTMQLGLFAPQIPEPSRLDVTLARLRAIVGDDRVGSPVLEDTHRPSSFTMQPFTLGAKPIAETHSGRMALRRVRPPQSARVSLGEKKPIEIMTGDARYSVVAAYGPWKSNGCWWSAGAWDIEEWDILADRASGGSVGCLLVHNRQSGQWHIEAFYD